MIKGHLLNDRYQVIDQIGQGGMSDVYLAKDLKQHRLVAIKILRIDFRDNPHTQAQFKRETHAISQLDSPNIVDVYGFNDDDGLQYSVMEYVKGSNLKDYIKTHPQIPIPLVIKIMNQILNAVAMAHQNNIVHRDLKPENVLIDSDGNVKITDFGIAIFSSEKTLTQTNSIVGSIHYLSPEQVRGEIATKQSDIYSLGIIMYELLTSHVPFDGDNPVSIALKHSKEPLPSIHKQNHAVPMALENVVLKATAKNPSQRYDSIQAMQADLNAALHKKHVKRFVPDNAIHVDDETKVMDLNQMKQYAHADDQVTVNPKPKRTGQIFWYTWGAVVAIVLVSFGLLIHFCFVQVPTLSGLSKTQAIHRLKEAGLHVDRIQYRYDDNVAINQAFNTNPGPNSWVLRNKAVTLVLSNGVSKVNLNNYIGQDYQQSAKELSDQGFTVEKTYTSSDTFSSGKILKQNFTPGDSFSPRNKVIKFVVSDGIREFTLKKLVGMTKDEAASYVEMMGLNPTFDYQYNDEYPAGSVFNQNPDSGLTVYNGDNVIISISKGPKTNNKSSNTQHTLNVNVNLPYVDNENKSNQIEIYVKDENNNINHIYRSITIYQDTKFIIPFKLNGKQPGEYRIVRDGKTISDVKNIN
ncbi:Stk1 family PASTA domain-containing Ser/Thr kinase [Nicoliella lavandulae]|uniref:non-specific serine/threonine protein kinase n=1 Tax=Nicoliella lavandulae TaxID=3082954 RepID=A0ABU8SKY8_9LACO